MKLTHNDCLWKTPPAHANLLHDEVHIWRAWLAHSIPNLEYLTQTLSVDERTRAERFQFEQDKKRFIIGRGLLRTILGYYSGLKPGQLHFSYGIQGKPKLVEMR
jgi:4'-phosphopantetheinyl transferase